MFLTAEAGRLLQRSGNDFVHVMNDALDPLAGYLNMAGATDGDDSITLGTGDDVIKAAGG